MNLTRSLQSRFTKRNVLSSVSRTVTSSQQTFHRSFASDDGPYDVAVIGGGPGGYVAAIKAAQLGLKTICIEARGSLGGTCLNVGCIPSKALLHSSHLYEHAVHGSDEHGVKIGNVELDLDKLLKNKSKAVKGLTGGIEHLFKKNKVTYAKGFGKIIGKTEISIDSIEEGGGNTSVTANNIIIATGSEVMPLPPCPVDNPGKKIVDSTGALDLDKVPEKMAVIGGGYIGLEMGSVWRRLGAEVTVVEFLDRIVPAMDTEITANFTKILKKQGMKFQLGTKVTASEVTDGGKVQLTTEPSAGGDASTEEFDVVLVSTGRRPFTQNLGLQDMGIAMDKMGRVVVNDEFRTNIPNIFAIGDVIDGPMLAHKAEEEGVAAVEYIAGKHGHVNYDAIPGVIYTYPEVASVGKTEDELKEEGVSYNKGTFPFMANSRGRSVGETEGMVKMLSCKDTDRILGIHIIGSNAGEMIAEGVLGMEYGASSEDIARTCHAHPTLSEAFKEAAMATYDKAIHF
eukprot:g1368.t1